MTTSTEPTDVGASAPAGLKANLLGLFDSVVMAVAGSAPAYTIAGSTTVLPGRETPWIATIAVAIVLSRSRCSGSWAARTSSSGRRSAPCCPRTPGELC
jgi:hypothetical protein